MNSWLNTGINTVQKPLKEAARQSNYLAPATVRAIRKKFASGGVNFHQLAAEFGKPVTVIWNIVRYKTYTDL